MFGNLGLATKVEDEKKARIPPPPATPLDFPCCRPQRISVPLVDGSQDLVKAFSNILRGGPSLKHLELLNVDLADNISLDLLLPEAFLPPLSWIQDPSTTESLHTPESTTRLNGTLSNGGPVPGQVIYYTRAKELLFDNEDAFCTLLRKPPPPGHTSARVLHLRKFWQGMSYVAEYWDTSLDNYSKCPKKEDSSTMDIDECRAEAPNLEKMVGVEKNGDQVEETYTGRRIDTGQNMPGTYREDTVFSFVEAVAWCFRCKVEHARMQPKLKLQSMVLPLPHLGSIYRMPKDSRQARRNILEGPLAGVFCREQTSFRRPEDAEGEGKQEIMDLLRELGLTLMLAQKRQREGQTEEVVGEGKWWATKPRWGGGPGGDFGAPEEENTEEPASSDAPRKRSKRMNRAELWRNLKPPSSTWEKGVTYQRIGKDESSEYDDIYLISSVNHHISILHLRIHTKFVEWLPDARKDSDVSNEPWYRLEMRRSKWFDLLVPDDRIQAWRGTWAVMSWLMRDVKDKEQQQDQEMG